MRYRKITQKTSLKINNSTVGERLEEKVQRITYQDEVIKDGVEMIYQERKAGVEPAYDIRTDRFEIANMAMNYTSRADIAKRNAIVEVPKVDGEGEKVTHTE